MPGKRIGKPLNKRRRSYKHGPSVASHERDCINLAPENNEDQQVSRKMKEFLRSQHALLPSRRRKRNISVSSDESVKTKQKHTPKKSKRSFRDLKNDAEDAQIFARNFSVAPNQDNVEFPKTESKKHRRLLKLVAKKKIKRSQKTLQHNEDEMEFQRDAFLFGEVVQAPPKLRILKKTAKMNDSIINKSAPSSIYGKNVTPARQKLLNDEREKVFAQYKQLKLMKYFNGTVKK